MVFLSYSFLQFFFVEFVVGGRTLKSLESQFDSGGGESRKVYQFDFLTISTATENFSEANKICQGQYDSMYKVSVITYLIYILLRFSKG